MNNCTTVEEYYEYINECGSNLDPSSRKNNTIPSINIVMIECRKLTEFVNTIGDVEYRRHLLESIEYDAYSNLYSGNSLLYTRNKHILDAAYQRIRFVLDFCNNIQAEKIWVSLIILCGRVLRYVPKEVMTLSMCELSLRQDIRYVKHMPIRLLKHTFCAKWIKKYPFIIKYLPKEVLSYSLYEVAAETAPILSIIRIIPMKFITPRLAIKVINKNPSMFPHLPKSCRTREVCLKVLNNNGDYIKYIDDDIITYEYCLVAAKNRGFKYIPSQFVSTELYMLSLQSY
jgi:hypothetical protein